MSNDHQDSHTPDPIPRFGPGQLVRHRRYDYRGVVVDFDMSCKADEQWYQKNRTQPARDQPWYHVLVDGATAVTYAAETSLEPDTTHQPVHHPLVPRLFEAFHGDHYQRNGVTWPGWDAAGSEDEQDEGDAGF